MKSTVRLTVNQRVVERDVEADAVLVDVLREELRLTGTHIGCDSVSCGSCTVLLNGVSVKSCAVLALQCEGQEVRTVEGIADGEPLHPLQEAFRQNFALQCGFCTPGFLMRGLEMIERGKRMCRDEIAEGLQGNYCRCTGYTPIVEAIYEEVEKRAGGQATCTS